MKGDLTHASFFSGVGGLDIGLERAGWATVSFSEIDPYASAVLAERWPGVPNLGDITRLSPDEARRERVAAGAGDQPAVGGQDNDWPTATLWTGGFPCQDLSVAGKRAGFTDGTRSSLAFTFLGLVERHRPAALLLENVPGLLSSNSGGDMGRLLSEMVELGYGVAWRVLDARHFGVPQRRRRVFIVGLRSGPDDATGSLAAVRAASVLAVGTRCPGHPPTGVKAGSDAPDGLGGGIRGALSIGGHVGIQINGQDAYTGELIVNRPAAFAGGVRAPDGLAGRVDDSDKVEVSVYTKAGRAQSADHAESWTEGNLAPTLNSFDTGDVRATALLARARVADSDDQLLPPGLDSHRYRCAGNGVVAPVAEWIGVRLAALFDQG